MTAVDAAAVLPAPQRYRAMLVIVVGLAMSVLDMTIVNLALPAIARDLDASAVQAVWVVNAYQLTAMMMLLPGALLGDLIGHRRVYLGGLVLFTVASLACALSASLSALIAARALQGLGAAGLMSVNMALLRLVYPKPLLGRGIAINAVTVSVASVAGPSLAAGVLSSASWPWLFGVNLPLGVLVLVLGASALPRNAAVRPAGARLAPLDVLLNALMFGLLFLGVGSLGTRGSGLGGRATGLLLIALAAGVAVVHVRRQRTLVLPLLPLDLIRLPVFALSMATSVMAFAAQTLAYMALPFLLLEGLQRSAGDAGLLITAWPLATAAMAPFAGRLIGRVPDGLLGACGLLLMALGAVALAALPHGPGAADIAWRLALCGAGFGLFQSPNNHAIVTASPAHRSGAAGGMLGTARLAGQTAGALLLAIVFSQTGEVGQTGPAVALVVAAALALAAGTCSALRPRRVVSVPI